MIKLINWLTKIIIQTMFVAALTVFLTWVSVHTYVDKLLSKYNLDTPESKVNFSDFLSQMSENLNILKPSQINNQATEKTSELARKKEQISEPSKETLSEPSQETLAEPLVTETEISPTVDSEGLINPIPTPTPTNVQSTDVDTAPDDSVSVWKQTNNASKQKKSESDKQKELVMSAEQLTKKKDLISEADKAKIFTLLVTRLPQSQFQQISTYLEGGVTEQEWLEIQSIVEQHVKPQEYKELQDLLAQY